MEFIDIHNTLLDQNDINAEFFFKSFIICMNLITKARPSLTDWLTPLSHAAQSKAFLAKKKRLALNNFQTSFRGRVDKA